MIGSELAERLRAVGLDATRFGDPAAAWRRLHDRYGVRATLLDRYALEAAARGVAVHELPAEVKERLTLEVLGAHAPGFEVVGGSERHRRDPIEVVAYDPAWPARYEAWRDQLAGELGATALRVDHVGSTAVPGLAAKPIIDVQVSVRDVEDEATYVPAIERAGVAFRSREVGHRYFRPSGDRPRDVQVHVCRAGSDWERLHLLFRDFLRAQAPTRYAYGRLKLELAERYRDDRIAYNEAKTAFILDALEEARAWADADGETAGA